MEENREYTEEIEAEIAEVNGQAEEYRQEINEAIAEVSKDEITVHDISEHKEPPEKSEQNPELAEKHGSEGTPRPHNYPTEPEKKCSKNIGLVGKSSGHATKREKLEAMKEGLETYIEQESARTSTDQNVNKYRPRSIEMAQERIQQIDKQLEQLPPDPPEKEPEPIPEVTDDEARAMGYADESQHDKWKENTQNWDLFLDNASKAKELDPIESAAEAGLFDTQKNKIGREALGQIAQDRDELIRNLGVPPHLASLFIQKVESGLSPEEAAQEVIEENELDNEYDYDNPAT